MAIISIISTFIIIIVIIIIIIIITFTREIMQKEPFLFGQVVWALLLVTKPDRSESSIIDVSGAGVMMQCGKRDSTGI